MYCKYNLQNKTDIATINKGRCQTNGQVVRRTKVRRKAVYFSGKGRSNFV